MSLTDLTSASLATESTVHDLRRLGERFSPTRTADRARGSRRAALLERLLLRSSPTAQPQNAKDNIDVTSQYREIDGQPARERAIETARMEARRRETPSGVCFQ